MTDRMSAAQYNAMMAKAPKARGRSSGGRMLRLPADFLQQQAEKPSAPLVVPAKAFAEAERVSSAQKARERVFSTVEALETARTEVEFHVTEDGHHEAVIRVVGGETLPPNRANNIAREQAKASQRTFSRYKHACTDRMKDAAMLLVNKVRGHGMSRFNPTFAVTEVAYMRQVATKSRLLDEDAVVYSFKYILDGLVKAGVLVDDSKRYVRIGTGDQCVGEHSELVIYLTVKSPRGEAR